MFDRSEYNRKYREEHKEYFKDYQKNYETREEANERQHKRREENIELYRKNARDRYAKHKAHPRIKRVYTEQELVDKNKRRIIKHKESMLKRKYDISIKDFEDMLEDQENRCAICGVNFKDVKGYPSIDHDHLSGDVRGVLCHSCNVGLGFFKDDIARLQEAIEYLIRNQEE